MFKAKSTATLSLAVNSKYAAFVSASTAHKREAKSKEEVAHAKTAVSNEGNLSNSYSASMKNKKWPSSPKPCSHKKMPDYILSAFNENRPQIINLNEII